MKIIHLDTLTTTMDGMSLDPFNTFDDFTHYDETAQDQVVPRAIDADILIVNKVVINEEIMNQLPKLKYICVSATGYNNVDIKAARQRNIPVSNVSGYSTNSVVQHVFSMALHALVNVAYYDEEVIDGRWSDSSQFTFYDHSIRELNGKTMGIYGFGTIGQKVADVAHAFGMKVIAMRRRKMTEAHEFAEYVDFDTLIRDSDILTLHSSLNESNQFIMNAEVFRQMKPSSILINTARGGLIHEADLAQALNNEELSYACLDVLSSEPPPSNNPLLSAKNCIITPHIAWTSYEARTKLLSGVVENIVAFVNNRPLLNVVNE